MSRPIHAAGHALPYTHIPQGPGAYYAMNSPHQNQPQHLPQLQPPQHHQQHQQQQHQVQTQPLPPLLQHHPQQQQHHHQQIQQQHHHQNANYGPPPSMQYSTPETADMMIPGRHQYQMYTPQSNSPASVASPMPDQRSQVYAQPPPPLPSSMYYPNYAVNHNTCPQQQQQQQQQHHQSQPQLPHQPPLGHHQLPQQHNPSHLQQTQTMTPPPSALQHAAPPPPPLSLPSSSSSILLHHGASNQPSPRMPAKREFDPARSALTEMNGAEVSNMMPSHHPVQATASALNSSNNSEGNTTPTSAVRPSSDGRSVGETHSNPGPIPATTPTIVSHDPNGVHWIAFEYSRDRVKTEYIIRCDVESVNTDNQERAFKEANCVYPRAFCNKDEYKGNRQKYESDCNTVGWSLAQLNPALIGKRGLIQRAVDSWRNSNSNSKLRSRRVRREAKKFLRRGPSPTSDESSGPLPQHFHPSSTLPSASAAQRPLPAPLTNGSSIAPAYNASSPAPRLEAFESEPKFRPAQVFHGYGGYPLQPTNGGPSMAPSMLTGLETPLGNRPPPAVSTLVTAAQGLPPLRDPSSSGSENQQDLCTLWSDLPERLQKRKFINVADQQGMSNKVRVNLDLRDVNLVDVVDDFRERNSVYPRSFSAHILRPSAAHMQRKRKAERMSEPCEVDVAGMAGNGMGEGRTFVPLRMAGGEQEAPVPRLGKRVGEREEQLNKLGYRIAWKSGKHFDQKPLLLQRSRK